MPDPITKKAWDIAVYVVLKKVFQGMFDWLQQEVAYVVSYESKVQDLKQRVDYLKDARDKVKRQVEVEKRNGKEIGAEIEKWLKKVDDIIHQHVEFEKLDDHKNAGCSGGLFPNPQSRYILGKKAYEMAQKVKGLREDSNFDGFSFWLGPMSIDYVLSTIGYESFKSRQETIEKIKEKLKDSSVRIRVIGVWGQGGVGKTTLTKKVAEEVKDTFNVIAMASVTRNPDPKKIQGEIAYMLGMTLDEESEIGRGDRIRNRLTKETKNTLIILDDLWAKLDLRMLGIPSAEGDFSDNITVEAESKVDYRKREKKEKSQTEQGRRKFLLTSRSEEVDDVEAESKVDYIKKEKKEKSPTEQGMFKILLTSRSEEVLSSQMGVDNKSIFGIKALQENEAEKLFKKVAGLCDKSPAFEQLSTNIVKKCGGLPLAVVTIGRALKGKSQYEWNDVLRQLEKKELTGVQESLEFPTRLSFNHLENEELKSAFLLCAQMGHHPLIFDLMKYCYSLRLLGEVDTIKEARDRTFTLIRKLKSSSLLLDSDSGDNLRMHDMVRDVALSMLAKERCVLTMRDDRLDEWPEKDQLERFSSISLHNCDINDGLPEGICFDKLKVFHINSKDQFLRIPDKGMTKLSVLILTGIRLRRLPFSNDSLANNLRMLCLEQCQLDVTDNLCIIGKLKKLRILSFSGSEIKELPSELGNLSNLQLFDVSNCPQLQVIPPNVMSCLVSLEELYMRNSPIQWGVEEKPNNKTQIATLTELSHLHQLKNLDVCISNAAVFPRNLFFDELDNYKIFIGFLELPSDGDFAMPSKYEASRTLVLQLKDGMDIQTYSGIKMLFRRVERLLLGELHGVKNVFYELNLEGFQCLKHFSIQNNNDIQCIIESKEMSGAQVAFPNLEWLFLFNLENIKTVCCGELPDSSFCKLKFIKIKNCAQLKSIFPISMVRLLKQLEEVEVSGCELLKGIVREENTNNNREDAEPLEFCGLRSLVLQSLSVFTSFFTKVNGGVITSPSIFDEQVKIPNLETLELSSINNEIQNIWSGQPAPSFCFQKLVTLNVNDCKGFTYLFSFSEAKNLENLKTISVSECDKMENIFKSEEISTTEAKVCIFPKLEKIYLSGMMSLSEIWHSKDVRVDPFPTLSSVIIKRCEKLVTVFPHHTVGLFPRLEELKIYRCNSVRVIFDLKDVPQNNEAGNETNLRFVDIWYLQNLKHVWNRDPKGILSFKNMEKIVVRNCGDLENLFPPSFAKDLENLYYLSIVGCSKLHGLIAWDAGPVDISLEFPGLTFLEFSSLPKLESIYREVRHTLELSSLKKLVVGTCDKLKVIPIPTETNNQDNPPAFLREMVISNLEYMNLSQKEAERLHHYVDSDLLHRLKELHIASLQCNAILHKILRRIPNLEKLSLSWGHLRELLPSGRLVAHEKIGTVIQIKELRLQCMYFLGNIGFERDPVLQRVELLYVLQCNNLESFSPSRVSFTHLKSLEVGYCNKLLNLMGSSTAKSLVKLTTMKVTQCYAMTEIVGKERNEEGGVEQQEIVFRKLITLELGSLENLISFCSCKNHSLNFPVLEKLIVRECPKMKIFSESPAAAPILRQVSLAYANDEGMWLCERDLNATLKKISTVTLKYKDSLQLSQYPELERVWHREVSLPEDCFCNLKNLVVTNCDFLTSVIPFHLLACLMNLKVLEVSNCNRVAVIFDMNDTKMTKNGEEALRLKTLSLDDLPNLQHVWSKDPKGLISFGSLQDVSVDGCKRLETLFPKSVAKNLLELEELYITKCGAFEEIVGKGDAAADGATDEMFEFPRLTELWLSELPELKCFYCGRFNLKCPVLEDLDVNHCGKFDIFKSESESYEKAASEDEIIPTVSQSLFPVRQDPERVQVWHGQVFLPNDCFCNLKTVKLTNCGVLSSGIPIHLLSYLINLEKLQLSNCNRVEVIFDMNDTKMTKNGEEAFRLKTLSLSDLPNLKHVWNKDPQGLISFGSLQYVSVLGCKRLETLFPKSVAKNLSELVWLHITKCGAFEEIVGKGDAAADGATDERFDFHRLAALWLSELPELKCFYCGRFTLKCPNLKDLVVNHCGKLEIFKSESESYGKAASEDEIISTEPQTLFSAQEDPERVQVWHGQVFLPNDCFCNLKTVKLTNCGVLSSGIPIHVLSYLINLEKLQLSNCNRVEVIFDMNDTKMTKNGEEAFRLKTLSLSDLPNLKHVWNKDPQGLISFGSLQDVSVDGCKRLETLFPKSVAKNLSELVQLHITKCGAFEEIVGKGDAAADGATDERFDFHRLTALWLSELPELKCFYCGRFNLKCPNLKDLVVNHCGKLEIFKSESESYGKAASEDEIISTEPQTLFSAQEDPERVQVWHGQVILPNNCFCNLKTVKLTNCGVLSSGIPIHLLSYLINLEKLQLSNCNRVEVIFDMNDTKMTKNGEEALRLKTLSLSDLPNLKHVWNKDPQGLISIGSLQDVSVDGCNRLETLFPKSVAKNLLELKGLHITNCRAFEEIVGKEDGATDERFDFPRLTALWLSELPELKCFYCGRFNLKCPVLEDLDVNHCGKFEIFKSESESYEKAASEDEIIPTVSQSLFPVRQDPERVQVWHGQVILPNNCFCNLKTVKLTNCGVLSSGIPIHLLSYLINLEKLQLSNCNRVEVIFDMNDTKMTKNGEEAFRLKTLSLSDLPNLKHVWNKDPQGLISFGSLQDVSVDGCNRLETLFPKSVAKNLLELKGLHITNCRAFEEIVGKEDAAADGATNEMYEFPRLAKLRLSELPELKCFYCGRFNLKCPVLEDLNVNHCGKLEIFKSESESYEKATSEDEIIPTVSQSLFPVRQDPEFERVWHGQLFLPDDCFCNLKTLKVTNCDFLSSVIPFHLLAYLSNLEELRLSNCNLVEVIFDMNDTKMTKTVEEAFRLKTLSLDDLPNLKHVWSQDPKGLVSFGSLEDVSVVYCKRLRTLFPKSVAKNLLKLEKLSIRFCRALEEIVGKEEAAADGAIDETFDFPRLTELLLFELPELKCFYWGRFNLKCPLLKGLCVIQCGKLEIFKSESQSSEKAASEDQIIRIEAQSLFSVQEAISTLREVALNERDINMLWRGGFQESLHNLKWLQLQGFHNVNETDHLPFEILRKVPNLETFSVYCCDFTKISFSGICEDYRVTMPAPFKRLELWRLPRLNSIGSKHSSIDSVLENLEVLLVKVCPCLTKVIQSSVPFSSLKELHIDRCDGLVHLFTSSAVNSLVRLEEIHVEGCESITEIVAEDTDDSGSASEILFEQLKVLDLNSLPSLGSFYSGSSTLKFPYLKDVKIIKCPRMNTFSNGITEVPMFGKIQVSEKNSRKVHDLKSTVDKMFNEKISFAYMEILKLSTYPELEPLWLGKVPLPENCFSNLKTLMVENCEFLSNVIPSNLLPYLKSLEELRVRNCTSVEVIFDINEIKTSETEQKGFLLKKLTLDQLPKLKLVWNKNPQRIMSFEQLQKVKVSDCKSLQYLFPAASMAKHLLKLKVQNCEALEEILGKEEVSETFEFRYLTKVILNHLPELNCFYPGRLNLKCPKLKVLNVYHCGKLEIFTSETRSNQAILEDQVGVSVNGPPIFKVEEVTPKLEEVSLNEKETMTLWDEEYQANFVHNIKCLQLYCFHSVTDQEDTLSYGLLHKVPNLEILAVACSDFKMIFPSRELEDKYIGVLSKLKGLRLEALPKLSSIGLEHSWLVTLSRNLETLEIRICSSLTNIVQSAVSFSNLRELTVIECHGLIHLFTSSTAKSLGQLRKMSIGKCKSMREIVAKEEKESSEDEIVLGQLTKLSLNNLPNLGSFYAGDSTLRFPYLQEVIITQCSKMKVFSQGFICAPQLPSIRVSLEKPRDVRWDGDLNSTVKKLFKGKEVIVNP